MINAHQHFWRPARGIYTWMPKGNAVPDRDYLPGDLAPVPAAKGVKRTVMVQAAASMQETEYMLGLADATPFVAGVVGWVDLDSPQNLQQFAPDLLSPEVLRRSADDSGYSR